MRVELLPGLSNVVRFPVERRARATLDLLRDIAPDVREVLLVAEGFHLEASAPDLRETADRETATYILNTFEPPAERRTGELEALLQPVVQRAVNACRAAHEAAVLSVEAQQASLSAQTSGGFWLEPLAERAESLTQQAAVSLLEAHCRSEEAFGVARAVQLAVRGEPWSPRDHQSEIDAMLAMGGRLGRR